MSREMKDSGIEWIGDIPKDWAITKLKNIIDFISGYAFKSELFTISDNNKKVITIKSFNNKQIILDNLSYSNESLEFPTKYLLKNNDILFAMSGGTTGKNLLIEQVDDLYYINQRVGIIRSSFNKFIYYYINTGLFSEYINLFSLGSAQPNISATDIQNFIIALPEKETIKKIEIYIDYQLKIISNIIDTTYQSIEELKKYKQSLITEAVTKGLDSTVEMKNSGIEWIGQVPEHWVVTRPNRVTTITRGNSEFQKIDMKNTGDYIAVQYGQVYKLNVLDEKYQLYVDAKFYKGEQIVQKGDTILISTSETIEDLGHSCFYNRKDFGLLGGEQLCLKPNKQVLFDKFLYYATTYFNLELNQYATGLKVYRFKLDDLKKINMILPPTLGEQQQIVQYLDYKISTIDSLIEDKTKVIEELENYKKSLIYEYVTGKKEV